MPLEIRRTTSPEYSVDDIQFDELARIFKKIIDKNIEVRGDEILLLFQDCGDNTSKSNYIIQTAGSSTLNIEVVSVDHIPSIGEHAAIALVPTVRSTDHVIYELLVSRGAKSTQLHELDWVHLASIAEDNNLISVQTTNNIITTIPEQEGLVCIETFGLDWAIFPLVHTRTTTHQHDAA